MKKMTWLATLALLVLGLAGCHCMRSKCGCCATQGSGNAMCAKCGTMGDKCKCGPGQKMTAEINTAALKSLIDSGATLTILDARTGKYDDGRRIPGARALTPDAKDEEIGSMLKSKDTLIVTYCANLQCPASGMLAKKLRSMGYKNVLEYHYGIEGWAAEGNPVTQAK